MTRPARSSVIAIALVGTAMLAGCTKVPSPPPLSERDLQNAFSMEAIGKEAPDATRAVAATPGICIDLHRDERSIFSEAGRDIGRLNRMLMQLGVRGGFTDWHEGGLMNQKPIDPDMAGRLSSATRRLTLKFAGKPAPAVPDKPWPERCEQRYWLTRPLYQDEFAFVESGSSCSGLCGGGSLIALEYRNGRWRVVGVHDTWMA